MAPWVPGPMRPRSLFLLDALREHHDVGIVCAVSSADEAREFEDLNAAYAKAVPIHRLAALGRVVRAVPSRKSLQQEYLNSRAMRDAITSAQEEFAPELCYFNVLRSAQWRGLSRARRNVIDLDEFRSGYYDISKTEARTWPERLLGGIEGPRMRLAESTILRDFDVVLVSSPLDASAGQEKVRVVRSAPAISLRDRPSTQSSRAARPTVIFAGRQSYSANKDAAHWFVRDVWPLILRQEPSALLRIVGADPPKSTCRLASPNIEVTGAVADIAAEYSAADVSVAPVLRATGVQMKVIESIALGVPTVVSSRVAAGAGLENGVNCLVGGDAKEWAEQVHRLLSDRKYSESLASNATRWFVANHSASAVAHQLATADLFGTAAP